MEIAFLGHECFRLRGKDVTLVTDPFDLSLGALPARLSADIVTISHDHAGHTYADGVDGVVRVVRGPGEYEIKNVLINGVATFHDDKKGQERGRNTVYVIELDELRLCHLGDLGHILSSDQVDEIGTVDVLFVSAGGGATLQVAKVPEVISQLEPSLVVPMNYTSGPETFHEEILAKFCHEMGLKDYTPEAKLSVTKSGLPSETQIKILGVMGQKQ